MKHLLKKDLSRRSFLWLLAFLFAARLLLASFQDIYITPDSASMDDALMFRAAQSITAGNWMGDYSWVAAGKHMFFALWLAFLHAMHIPYVLGGQLLYITAALLLAIAVFPLLSKNWTKLLVFAAVAYNPVSWAAFTLRVYRDNIFPALCILFFAGFLGFMLRLHQPVRAGIGWALLGGLGFGLAVLTREDGLWLLPFALAATLFYLICVLRRHTSKKERAVRSALALLPFSVLLLSVCLYSLCNLHFYGRFMVSDFTSREFKDAYGAITRIHSGEPVPMTPVTYEERMHLYQVCPKAAELGAVLDNGHYYNGFGNAEKRSFNSGGFYWAIRYAVQDMGYYQDAKTAKAYYEELAAAINEACDAGLVPNCSPRRSGTLMPFDSSYLLPLTKEIGSSLRALLFFEDTLPYYDAMSLGKPEVQQEWVDYLHNDCTRTAAENSALPYRNLYQRLSAFCLQAVTWLLRLLIWPVLLLAFLQLFHDIKSIFLAWCQHRQAEGLLPTVLQFGIFLCILLRVGMISYVEVTAFGIGTYVMYLSSAAPLILLFAGLGSALWLEKHLCK